MVVVCESASFYGVLHSQLAVPRPIDQQNTAGTAVFAPMACTRNMLNLPPEKIAVDVGLVGELTKLLVQDGAAIVGCADLSPVSAELRKGFPCGVSIGVALSSEVISGIHAGPTDSYAMEYDRANALLNALTDRGAAFLRSRGHHAVAVSATVLEIDKKNLTSVLPSKTVATLAGIGWIGKSALLVTELYGSAVRYASILTDAPLPVGSPVTESRCGDCRACVDACPSHAIAGRNWQQGLARQDLYDAFACFKMARQQSENLFGEGKYTICGICIAACPYTKKYLKKTVFANGVP